jgi:hypothetical protein
VYTNRKLLLSVAIVFTLCLLSLSINTCYAAINTKPIKNIRPSITVTEPSNSTVWLNHERHTIAWKSFFVQGDVRIEVWKDGIYHSTLVSSVSVGTNGVGSYEAYISSAYTRSGKYQIKVISLSNENVSGISPTFFINEKVF